MSAHSVGTRTKIKVIRWTVRQTMLSLFLKFEALEEDPSAPLKMRW